MGTPLMYSPLRYYLVEVQRQTADMSDNATKQEVREALNELQNKEGNLSACIITPHKIRKIIAGFRPYKAAGDDQIQFKLLKKLPKKAYVQIYYVFSIFGGTILPNGMEGSDSSTDSRAP